jgi:transposase
MPKRHELTSKEWETIEPLLPRREKRCGRPRVDDRKVINAILWILGTGAPWRDLPESYGKWNTVYNRFQQWTAEGVWENIFNTVTQIAQRGSNVEFCAIIEVDSTTCKAHQHAAGGKGGRNPTL